MDIEELSYNEIQKELSSRDLKAQGPKEELKQRLQDALDDGLDKSPVKEDETIEVKEDPFEATKAQVLDGEEVVREYTKEVHGEGFVDKAELYAESHSNPNLTVEKF